MLKNITNKKQNINVNAYMKKSKRNKENISELQDTKPDIIPECVIPDVIIPDVQSAKALNLIKARQARQDNLKNKNTSREERIINLVNEIKQEELLKIENKTEKLKIKLLKLI